MEEIGYGGVCGAPPARRVPRSSSSSGRRGWIDEAGCRSCRSRLPCSRTARRRPRRLGLHRGVRGRRGLRRPAPATRRRGRLPRRGARRPARRRHVPRLRRGHARARRSATATLRDRRLRRAQPDASSASFPSASRCSGPARDARRSASSAGSGPRGLASIVFAVILVEEGGLPHEDVLVTTVGRHGRAVGPRARAHGRAARRPLRVLVRLPSARRAPALESGHTTHVRWRRPATVTPRRAAAAGTLSRPERWQSGRMRRSRKPLGVVRLLEGSNPSLSAEQAGFRRFHGARLVIALQIRDFCEQRKVSGSGASMEVRAASGLG